MASFKQYTASGGASEAFSIPSFTSDEIKVRVEGVLKTAGTHYNITSYTANGGTVTWTSGNVPSSGTVYIYRDTKILNSGNSDVEGKATYSNGTPIYYNDLNDNQKQALRSIEEENDQLIQSWDIAASAVESTSIKDGTIVDADINASANIAGSKLADDSVTLAKLGGGALPTDITVASANIVNGTIVNADVSVSAAIDGTKISPDFGSQNIATSGTVDGRDVSADGSKLDGIETGATADQTNAEIRAAVEAASDSNVFTDADHSKLNGIEAGATADLSNAEIRAAVEAASDSNVFTDADHTKLNAAATLTGSETLTNKTLTSPVINDMSGSAVVTSGTSTSDTKIYSAKRAGEIFYGKDTAEEIQSGETWSAADTKIATTAAIDARIVDLVDDVGGFVPIANETSFPTANPDVNNGAGTLVSIKALASNLTSNGSGVATIANGAGSGNTVTITGLANSTTYAASYGLIVETTSTLHTYTFHRQVPKATEVTTVAGSISSVNTVAASISDVNNFADLYQIGTSAPTQDGGGNSLAAGDLWYDSSSNKALMIYDGSSGDGFSAATPTAAVLQDIAIVSGQLTYVEDLGSITDSLTTGTGNNINTVASNISNVNTVAGANSNITTVAGSISNVNSVGGDIANVNTTASNLASINNFAEVYRIASSAPSSSLDEGDLWYDSTANKLKYYNGTAWTVTAAAGLSAVADDTSPELGGHLDCNNKHLTEVGTVSGDNLQIDFGTLS